MTCRKSLTMFPTLTHSPSASLTSLLLRPHQVSSCLRIFTLIAASSRTCASGATFILQLLQVTFSVRPSLTTQCKNNPDTIAFLFSMAFNTF